ncbi:MAG: cob(I)yrinic acid a,c-diamide adenosyltransferase [Candidatus Vogelbacteria bacterium]|nr:cob(I)yrinic acid a,c-diamide adenosyltransferase [Candidatus Vogelbacteria bacterium]
MSWYSGNGDTGETSLYQSSARHKKHAPHIEALGTIDELNATLGWCRAAADGKMASRLEEFQQTLFIIQAELGGARKKIPPNALREIEQEIDAIEASLPPITTFIIPGGCELAARLECARTIARRAERRVAAFVEFENEIAFSNSYEYLNRLSSLLWAFARKVNAEAGAMESVPRY